MRNDMITIFNQLTSSKLADYTLFENIIDYHYEKFKYLYFLINGINLKKIEKIYCTENRNSMEVYIEPHENKYINDIVCAINDKRHDYYNYKYFHVDIIEDGGTLIINISMKNNREEGDIYANRFV